MFKLIALYKTPEDATAFETHYKEIHLPICRKIPLLKEMRLNRVFGSPMGKSPFYLQAELCWANKEDFMEGVKSPPSMESGKDIMNFAKGLVDIYFVEESVEQL